MELIIKRGHLRKKITIEDKPLARGGEGAVHKFQNHPEFDKYCIKLYHPNCRTDDREQKLKFMVQNKPDHSDEKRYLLCWPEELIYDTNDQFVGFMMFLAYPSSIQLYEVCQLRIKPKHTASWTDRFDRSTPKGNTNRAKLCLSLVQAINSLHATGKYLLVDFKPQNILITNTGKISVTDLDSIQISDHSKLLFPAKVATPEYAPREAGGIVINQQIIQESWDRFSLAVVIYEIMVGIHPYTASANSAIVNATTIDESIGADLFVHGPRRTALVTIPKPHESYNHLSAAMKALFQRAFGADPGQRPSTEEWGKAIFESIRKKEFEYTGTQLPPPPKPPTGPSKPLASVVPPKATRQVNTGSGQPASSPPTTPKWANALAISIVAVIMIALIIQNYKPKQTYYDSSNSYSRVTEEPVAAADTSVVDAALDSTAVVDDNIRQAGTGTLIIWSDSPEPVSVYQDSISEASYIGKIKYSSTTHPTNCDEAKALGLVIHSIPPGTYHLLATTPNGTSWTFDKTVPADVCTTQGLTLK